MLYTSPMTDTIPLVTSTEIDYLSIVDAATEGRTEDWVIYEFGVNQKKFWHRFNPSPIYEKPVSTANGITTHLSDPDLNSTNP